VLEKGCGCAAAGFFWRIQRNGYARTEMVSCRAVRGCAAESWIFSHRRRRASASGAAWRYRGVVREFRTRGRSDRLRPVNWTTVLPLTEMGGAGWRCEGGLGRCQPIGAGKRWGTRTLFELSPSSLEPVIFRRNLQRCVRRRMHCCRAIEAYEKLGMANAQRRRIFSQVERVRTGIAIGHTSGVGTNSDEPERSSTLPSFVAAQRAFSRRCCGLCGDVKSQLASGGTVFLTAASTGELERYADICREYEVPYVLGESENAAAGFTAEGALESAGLVLMRRAVWGRTDSRCEADDLRQRRFV